MVVGNQTNPLLPRSSVATTQMPSNFCLAANWKLFSFGAQCLKKLQKLSATPKMALVFSINSSSYKASNTSRGFFRLEWFATPKQNRRLPKQHFFVVFNMPCGGFGLLMKDLHQGDMKVQHAWKVQDSNFHSMSVWHLFFSFCFYPEKALLFWNMPKYSHARITKMLVLNEEKHIKSKYRKRRK